jgi:hypothetical protein
MSLRELKENIEEMTTYHQTEILRLLHNSNAKEFLNENQNGTFINISSLNNDVIYEMRQYCSYIKEQQATLSVDENEKERIEKQFFKDNKAKLNINDNEIANESESESASTL